MENKLLVGFAAGFILAYFGEALIDLSNGGLWAEIVLFLIGAGIIWFLWFVRKRPESK